MKTLRAKPSWKIRPRCGEFGRKYRAGRISGRSEACGDPRFLSRPNQTRVGVLPDPLVRRPHAARFNGTWAQSTVPRTNFRLCKAYFPPREPSLLTVLPQVYGVRPSEDVHLLITGFDYDRNRATFFRSSAASGPTWGTGEAAGITLAEAIHASTNAPVNYFDAPATFPDRPGRYWDGAISGCNNPVLAAVTEAIVKGQDPLNLAVLSIGTASVALPWPPPGQESFPVCPANCRSRVRHRFAQACDIDSRRPARHRDVPGSRHDGRWHGAR